MRWHRSRYATYLWAGWRRRRPSAGRCSRDSDWGRSRERERGRARLIHGARGLVREQSAMAMVAAIAPMVWAVFPVRAIEIGRDDEGVARLHDLLAPERAAEIRNAVGIRKRVGRVHRAALAAHKTGHGVWLQAETFTARRLLPPGSGERGGWS